jgi:hypothetical protein
MRAGRIARIWKISKKMALSAVFVRARGTARGAIGLSTSGASKPKTDVTGTTFARWPYTDAASPNGLSPAKRANKRRSAGARPTQAARTRFPSDGA